MFLIQITSKSPSTYNSAVTKVDIQFNAHDPFLK